MGLEAAALSVGEFLLNHADIVEDIVGAMAGGTPKDAIKAAIRGIQVDVSDDAILEELDAAEKRKAEAKP